MKNNSTQTFQFKLSNWRHNVKVNESWIPFGSIEYKGYPLTAQAPSLEDLHKVLPGCTYPKSRDSYWHLFGPHSGDQGEGDDVEISIELNVPKNMEPIIPEDANQQSCQCNANVTEPNSSAFNCDNSESPCNTEESYRVVTILFKIEQGTTYYSYDGRGDDWDICQAAKNPGNINPPPIDIIQKLMPFYARFSYQDFTGAQDLFDAHQGKNNLGDQQAFTVPFIAPVDRKEVDITWSLEQCDGTEQTCGINVSCPLYLGTPLAGYLMHLESQDPKFTGCVNYGVPSGRLFAWIYPPCNSQLKSYLHSLDLCFTNDQWNNACSIFWSHSGSCLGGDAAKFSVKMTQSTIGF